MEDSYRKDAGVNGENVARRYLRSQGLELVVRNYRCRAGEIDLVMLEFAVTEPPTLVLAEVRYRTLAEFGGAAASVYWRKQRRIIRAAGHLLRCRCELRTYRARFDVVALSPAGLAGDGPVIDGLRIEWLRHAFTA